MDSSENLLQARQASLEEDPYMPDMAFSDHVGKDSDLLNGVLYGNELQNASYQKFSRIASAQEMEEFESFFDTSEEAEFSLTSPDSGIHDFSKMDPNEKARMEEEWTRELIKTEEEINTLRQVLTSKIKKMQDLKKKLGITVWKEFKDDMEQGLQNIRDTNYYQKTSQTLKTASEKTSEAFGTLGATMSKKLEEVKQSSAYKNIEEKVGSAYTNVKTKVGGSSFSHSSSSERNGEPIVEKPNGSQIPADKQ